MSQGAEIHLTLATFMKYFRSVDVSTVAPGSL